MENETPKTVLVPEKTEKKVGVVKTYAEDMVKMIGKNEGGIIKKIIHEQEEKEVTNQSLSPESRSNRLFMIIGVILALSAVVLLVFLFIFKNQASPVNIATQFAPIIFIDKTEYKEISGLTKDRIIQTILNEVSATDVKEGGVEGIYLTENNKIIGFRRFIALIQGNLTTDQIPFVDDNFLLGIANKETKDLFILIKTRSFMDVFPIMKSWESKMFSDLHGLFGIGISADTSYLLTKDFEDGIVGNKNARILRDEEGKAVLEYVFTDDTSVVMAGKDEAVEEVMLRLASKQIKK